MKIIRNRSLDTEEIRCPKNQAFEYLIYFVVSVGLSTSLGDKVTNIDVLWRIGKELEVMNSLITRKLQYFGHMLKGIRSISSYIS